MRLQERLNSLLSPMLIRRPRCSEAQGLASISRLLSCTTFELDFEINQERRQTWCELCSSTLHLVTNNGTSCACWHLWATMLAFLFYPWRYCQSSTPHSHGSIHEVKRPQQATSRELIGYREVIPEPMAYAVLWITFRLQIAITFFSRTELCGSPISKGQWKGKDFGTVYTKRNG